MLSIGVVVVNYCSEVDVLRCLRSLADLELPATCKESQGVEIVLVDNCSPDGSGARLKGREVELGELLGPKFLLSVLLNSENRGFAAANNVGLAHLRQHGATHAWLLNPDTTVDPRAMTELLAHCSQEELAVCGSKVLYGDRERDLQSGASAAKIWSAGGVLNREQQQVGMRGLGDLDQGQYDALFSCDYIPGCSMFMPLAVLDRVGDMPERYFMYFEETDWCERMTRAGVSLRYVPSSVVWHHFSDEKMGRPFTVYYYNRNERLFWFRWGTLPQRAKLVIKTLIRDIPQAIRALIAAPDPAHGAAFRAQLRAYRDFLLARTGRR